MPELAFRPYAPGDECALRETLAELDPAREVPSEALWRWALDDNPHGRRALLAWDGARLAGAGAALPHRAWMDGREVVFAELAQPFFRPEYRRGLEHAPPLARLLGELFERHGGVGATSEEAGAGAAGSDVLFYGLPTRGDWRLGKKILSYEVIRNQNLLARAPGDGPEELPAGVELLERFDEQARWLWDRCVDELGCGTIRDAEFLNWRFGAHPEEGYELLGARDEDGVLRGYAVLGRGPWNGREHALVHDWLVPLAEPEVGERLRQALLARARATGARSLALVVPDAHPWFGRFQEHGFRVLPAETFVYGRVFQRRFDVLWLRQNWWYTLADLALAPRYRGDGVWWPSGT